MDIGKLPLSETGRHRSTWFAVVATLACLGAVPALWYLADEGILPWTRSEARWNQLRAATPGGPVGVDATSSISLRRTGCFGWCPIYRVTIHASGRVDYLGEHYVCDVGPRTVLVDRAAAAKLISIANTLKPASLTRN